MKIGNRVEILDGGGKYSSYVSMARAMNLKAFDIQYNECLIGLEGTVVAIKTHLDYSGITCMGIELDNGHSVIFDNGNGGRGPYLKRLPDKVILDEELFIL